MNTFDRQLTHSEVCNWVEQATSTHEQEQRAEDANAGYPIMLSELNIVAIGPSNHFQVQVRQIERTDVIKNYGDYITGIATDVATGHSYLVFFSDVDYQWYGVQYGPEEFYSNNWMPSVSEEQQAFHYSV